jgi:hypothetical protein
MIWYALSFATGVLSTLIVLAVLSMRMGIDERHDLESLYKRFH